MHLSGKRRWSHAAAFNMQPPNVGWARSGIPTTGYAHGIIINVCLHPKAKRLVGECTHRRNSWGCSAYNKSKGYLLCSVASRIAFRCRQTVLFYPRLKYLGACRVLGNFGYQEKDCGFRIYVPPWVRASAPQTPQRFPPFTTVAIPQTTLAHG